MLFHTKCISVPIMLVAFYYSFLLVLVEFRIAQKRLVTSYPDISRMIAVFAGIVVACFLYRSVCGQNSGWKSFSVENFALPDHKYKIITSISFSKCRNFCKSERACVSVNFQGSTELKGCCALNSRGVEGGREDSQIFSLHTRMYLPTASWYRSGHCWGTLCFDFLIFMLILMQKFKTIVENISQAESTKEKNTLFRLDLFLIRTCGWKMPRL